ncbi:splicing factor U2af large subunit A-like [Lotus japonicus]|uniref:splicing factor U2af large subunit A-like n=1 Tax=Lotus japonicus TaxID=34305 RepID=UPI002588D0C5|nr:splicing factor U2af large subunit A-like [Lotus japonicus]
MAEHEEEVHNSHPHADSSPPPPATDANSHATRHARRVNVEDLPPTANEQSVATFFSQVMANIGGNTAGPGDAVVNVCINHDMNFAFVEMRSVEEASNAMALDGIIFEGAPVKVRRPTDYNPSLAATLGPSQPNPNLNLGAVGLTPGSAGGLGGPDRIFVGGLPYYFTETQIRELLESFGPLRGFDLVKDRETGNSKGYAFCVYQDLAVTDIACAALNGIKMGDKTLTVRRANQGANPQQPNPNLNLAAIDLTLGSAGGLDGPDRIFVGGLPYYSTETQIRELLENFGPLRGFDLVKDRETGNSEAYAVCVYQDLAVTDIVCEVLNGINMGDRTLTVRRANQDANPQQLNSSLNLGAVA